MALGLYLLLLVVVVDAYISPIIRRGPFQESLHATRIGEVDEALVGSGFWPWKRGKPGLPGDAVSLISAVSLSVAIDPRSREDSALLEVGLPLAGQGGSGFNNTNPDASAKIEADAETLPTTAYFGIVVPTAKFGGAVQAARVVVERQLLAQAQMTRDAGTAVVEAGSRAGRFVILRGKPTSLELPSAGEMGVVEAESEKVVVVEEEIEVEVKGEGEEERRVFVLTRLVRALRTIPSAVKGYWVGGSEVVTVQAQMQAFDKPKGILGITVLFLRRRLLNFPVKGNSWGSSGPQDRGMLMVTQGRADQRRTPRSYEDIKAGRRGWAEVASSTAAAAGIGLAPRVSTSEEGGGALRRAANRVAAKVQKVLGRRAAYDAYVDMYMDIGTAADLASPSSKYQVFGDRRLSSRYDGDTYVPDEVEEKWWGFRSLRSAAEKAAASVRNLDFIVFYSQNQYSAALSSSTRAGTSARGGPARAAARIGQGLREVVAGVMREYVQDGTQTQTETETERAFSLLKERAREAEADRAPVQYMFGVPITVGGVVEDGGTVLGLLDPFALLGKLAQMGQGLQGQMQGQMEQIGQEIQGQMGQVEELGRMGPLGQLGRWEQWGQVVSGAAQGSVQSAEATSASMWNLVLAGREVAQQTGKGVWDVVTYRGDIPLLEIFAPEPPEDLTDLKEGIFPSVELVKHVSESELHRLAKLEVGKEGGGGVGAVVEWATHRGSQVLGFFPMSSVIITGFNKLLRKPVEQGEHVQQGEAGGDYAELFNHDISDMKPSTPAGRVKAREVWDAQVKEAQAREEEVEMSARPQSLPKRLLLSVPVVRWVVNWRVRRKERLSAKQGVEDVDSLGYEATASALARSVVRPSVSTFNASLNKKAKAEVDDASMITLKRQSLYEKAKTEAEYASMSMRMSMSTKWGWGRAEKGGDGDRSESGDRDEGSLAQKARPTERIELIAAVPISALDETRLSRKGNKANRVMGRERARERDRDRGGSEDLSMTLADNSEFVESELMQLSDMEVPPPTQADFAYIASRRVEVAITAGLNINNQLDAAEFMECIGLKPLVAALLGKVPLAANIDRTDAVECLSKLTMHDKSIAKDIAEIPRLVEVLCDLMEAPLLGFRQLQSRAEREKNIRAQAQAISLMWRLVRSSDDAIESMRYSNRLRSILNSIVRQPAAEVIDSMGTGAGKGFAGAVGTGNGTVRSTGVGKRAGAPEYNLQYSTKYKPKKPKNATTVAEYANLTPQQMARVALAGLGGLPWVPKVPGQKGLRILTLDGGGTRGVLSIAYLKEILKRVNSDLEPYQMFDLICGTSTGGIIACLLGAQRASLASTEVLYDEFIEKVFGQRSNLRLVTDRAAYDEAVLEKILYDMCGDQLMVDTQMHSCANVFCISSQVNANPCKPNIWRNYNYPPGQKSRYPGSCRVNTFTAVRATSAAPTFFTPVPWENGLYVDGALVANNPTAVAIQEAKVP